MTTLAWLTRLLMIIYSDQLTLSASKKLSNFAHRRKYVPEMRVVSLVACSVSTNSSKIKEYQLKLQKHSRPFVTKKALKNARTTKSFMESIL